MTHKTNDELAPSLIVPALGWVGHPEQFGTYDEYVAQLKNEIRTVADLAQYLKVYMREKPWLLHDFALDVVKRYGEDLALAGDLRIYYTDPELHDPNKPA